MARTGKELKCFIMLKCRIPLGSVGGVRLTDTLLLFVVEVIGKKTLYFLSIVLNIRTVVRVASSQRGGSGLCGMAK